MFSTVLELCGFAMLIAATFLLAGVIAALYVAGPVLLLLGYAVEDESAAMSLARAVSPVRRRVLSFRAARVQRRRKLAKAG